MDKAAYKNAVHNRHIPLSELASASNVFKNWISDSRIEKSCKEKGLDCTKTLILSDLKEMIGKNLSQEKYNYYEENINKLNSNKKLLFFIANAMCCGDNLSVI